jgi:TIR domain
MTEPPQELHHVAPTLDALKKLPPDQKDRLFLAKLAKISRNDANVLHKGNLMLGGDPFGLTNGYPITERQAVKEHLGAPWNRLVNEGHLVDLNGQGFHKVSAEGHDYLNQPATVPVAVAATRSLKPLPDRIAGTPRVFISYSWEGDKHEEWVWALAERLQSNGIQIIFDRWHLKPGQNKGYFMERAIAESDFVIIICTTNYATKANTRQGGVGYESMIITGEVADDVLTDKFIPVLREGSFKTSLPIYLKGHLGVDLTGDPYREKAYGELIRQLHGEPIVAPPIGKKPDFSTDAWRSGAGLSPSVLAANPSVPTVPTEQKPNAHAWASYDKPGQANAWISAIVRLWSDNRYSFEIVKGTQIESEDFFDTKDRVLTRLFEFNRSLINDGYKRMNSNPGLDPDFRSILS